MYLIETHLHTKEISHCGWLYADEIVQRYHAAGYSTLVVTDHYNMETWKYLDIDPQQEVDVMPQFCQGYERVREEARQYGIQVILGAELRFYENNNDYLLYNFPQELLANPHQVMGMGVAAFSEAAREVGALLIQAHPFRKKCVPLAPMLLAGVEVLNANPRHMHHNHNDWAQKLAAREGEAFICTAGSDCHRIEDLARSGIRSQTQPTDRQSFAALLRSGEYELIIPEDI